jgi:hypothetical protein
MGPSWALSLVLRPLTAYLRFFQNRLLGWLGRRYSRARPYLSAENLSTRATDPGSGPRPAATRVAVLAGDGGGD